MKIFNLTKDSKIYTSNVYLILGEWNKIDDINTLIDVGSDINIINKIENINTGLGKKKIDQIIITHSHSDHTAILPEIKTYFQTKTYAYNSHLDKIDKKIHDGDIIKIGDELFEVFNITVHSTDSICLLSEQSGIFFSGDTNFPINFDNSNVKQENSEVLERLGRKRIRTIYPGHGTVFPVNDNFRLYSH